MESMTVSGAILCLMFLRLPHLVTSAPAECINWLQVFPNCLCRSALNENGQELPTVALVDCSSQDLTSVPQPQRPYSRTLHELRLSNNRITTLPNDTFQGVKIRRLDLTGNSLGDIADHAFRGTENDMIVLKIEGDSLSLPQRNALSKLTSLEELMMKNYKIAHLDQFYFYSFHNLKKLTLDNCGIQSIDARAFVTGNSRNSLRSLTLLNQDLVSLPLDALHDSGLQNLESLLISHTKIKAISPYAFSSLGKVKEIILSHNEIQTIEEDSFTNVGDTLEMIDLSNNFLGSDSHNDLPHLKDLAKLRQLSLSNNEFRQMPKMMNLGNGQALSVDLSNNELVRISAKDLSSYIDRLQILNLIQNKIVHIDDDTFSGVSLLNSLSLGSQRGSSTIAFRVPISLRQAADTLTYLDLSGHNLEPTSLWQVVRQLVKLQTLILRNTKLTRIPDLAFENIVDLTTLDLSDNHGISQITDKTFAGPRTLQTLSLRSTSISAIPACFLANITGTLSLDMGFTQIVCNCSVKNLLERIRSGSVSFPDADSIPTCSDGSPLTQKHLSDLTCDPEECAIDGSVPSSMPSQSSQNTQSPLPAQEIQIRVLNITADTIGIAWDIQGFHDFQKFRVSLSSDEMLRHFDITSISVTQKNIQHLTADTLYQVCVYAYFSFRQPILDCEAVQTKSEQTQLGPDIEPSVPTPEVQIRVLNIDTNSMRIAWDITNTTELLYYTVTVSSTQTTKNYDQRPFNVTKQTGTALAPNMHDTDVCVYAYFTSGRPVSLCESVRTTTDPN